MSSSRRIRMPALMTIPFALALLPLGRALADPGWVQQTSHTAVTLNALAFVDANTGWICGASGVILHTTNGGATWVQQTSGTTLNLNGISFIDAQTGFVVGSELVALKTTDGGAVWQITDQPVQDGPWNAVQALDSQHIWRVGSSAGYPTSVSILEYTVNGGGHWSTGYRPTCPQFDPDHMYCSSSNTSLSIVNSQVGFVAGYRSWSPSGDWEGFFLRTTNGPSGWGEVPDPDLCGWRQIQFLNTSTGYGAGDCGYGEVWRTDDAGTTWTQHIAGATADWLSFIDVNHGWTAGEQGTILATTDGANTWTQLPSGTTTDLTGITMVNASVGTVIGKNGLILHTTSGGQPVSAGVAGPGHLVSKLLGPVPNPATGSVHVAYELFEVSNVSLGVFDASGRMVRLLDSGTRSLGRHTVTWDGTNASGAPVPGGVYFLRLNGSRGEGRQQVTLLR